MHFNPISCVKSNSEFMTCKQYYNSVTKYRACCSYNILCHLTSLQGSQLLLASLKLREQAHFNWIRVLGLNILRFYFLNFQAYVSYLCIFIFDLLKMFDFALKISINCYSWTYPWRKDRKKRRDVNTILLNSWIVYMLSIKVDTSGKVVYFYCVVSFLFALFLLINSIIFLFVVVTLSK